jgi:hypothetical protein
MRLFGSGAETNNKLETEWEETSGTMNFVTSPVHSGTYSVQPALAGPGGDDSLTKVLATGISSGTFWTRFYFHASQEGANNFWAWIHQLRAGFTTCGIVQYNPNTRKMRIVNDLEAGDPSAEASVALTAGTWYRVILRTLISDTVGELELRIYELESTTLHTSASMSGQDTNPGAYTRFHWGKMAGFGTMDAVLSFDDFAINDDTGTFENTEPGPGKIALVKPNGDNSVTWTKDGSAPAATNFEGVDDVPGAPDEGVTYNSKSSNGTDKLDLSNLPAEVPSDADIILLDVYGRQGSDGTTGTRNLTYELWDEADAQTTGPAVDCKISGWRIADSDEHLVFDAGARSKADIDSFRVGYQRNHGGGNEDRITAQWVNVEWTESAAAPDPLPPLLSRHLNPVLPHEPHDLARMLPGGGKEIIPYVDPMVATALLKREAPYGIRTHLHA